MKAVQKAPSTNGTTNSTGGNGIREKTRKKPRSAFDIIEGLLNEARVLDPSKINFAKIAGGASLDVAKEINRLSIKRKTVLGMFWGAIGSQVDPLEQAKYSVLSAVRGPNDQILIVGWDPNTAISGILVQVTSALPPSSLKKLFRRRQR